MKKRDQDRFLKAAREFFRSSAKEQRAVMIRAGVLPSPSKSPMGPSIKDRQEDNEKEIEAS